MTNSFFNGGQGPRTGLLQRNEADQIRNLQETVRVKNHEITQLKDEITTLTSREKTREQMDTQEKQKMAETMNMAKSAVKYGAQLAAASKVNDLITDTIVAALKKANVPEEILDSEAGRTILKVLAPLVLHMIASRFPEQVPKAELVKQGCDMALVGITKDTIEPILAYIKPMLTNVASEMANVIELNPDAESKVNVTEEPKINGSEIKVDPAVVRESA